MREKIAGIGALISAVFASICCVGPIVLVGLGLGGAGLAVGLAKYRPIFLVLTPLFLGAAFYLTYRKKEVQCEDGTCKLQSGSKTMKTGLWIITVFAVGIASFPHWSPYLLGKSSVRAPANAESIVLKVSGMTCAACAVGIEKSLRKVHGVQSASVDFDKSEAVVAVEHGKVSEEELLKAVQAAGPTYSAEIEKTN